ncbi:MAG: DNA-deoxyinosine glycosylase [Betaproteobacteria bacterium]|nr:DNA-deoxyinosine glycosylase [Betaproteobacteria bacterium]
MPRPSPSTSSPASRLVGLSPVYRQECRILILGSFPSPASLAARQYYGHAKNQFWRLLADSIHEPLLELDYQERIERTLAHQIGIWDVYKSCVRPGALDADIRAGTMNDLAALFAHMPHLERLCFNGQTAGKHAPRLLSLAASMLARTPETRILPSSSPAYTISFAHKLERWQEALTIAKPDMR